MMYNHPAFIDVRLEVLKRYYIKEKDMWSLKIVWWNKRGWPLCEPYRVRWPDAKWKEFERYE